MCNVTKAQAITAFSSQTRTQIIWCNVSQVRITLGALKKENRFMCPAPIDKIYFVSVPGDYDAAPGLETNPVLTPKQTNKLSLKR